MKLSIIIVNYNTLNITKNCIESIIDLNIKFKYEIILVDNNSSDGSGDYFKNYIGIKFIQLDNNFGFAKANNIGVKNSSGNYLLFLNSDTVLTKQSNLNFLFKILETTTDVGIVCPQLLNSDGSIQLSVRNFPGLNLKTFVTYFISTYFFKIKFLSLIDKRILKCKEPIEIKQPMGAALLINKELFIKNNRFNEQYFMYMEDVELCLNIIKQNFKIIYVPNCKIIHLENATASNFNMQSRKYFIKSLKIYFSRNVCSSSSIKFKIFISLGLFFRFIKRLVKH